MRDIIFAMVEDIKREGAKEIVWNKIVEKRIGRATALMYKSFLKKDLTNSK